MYPGDYRGPGNNTWLAFPATGGDPAASSTSGTPRILLDTSHVFAAGYPLAAEDEYGATMSEFDRIIGLDKIRVFHLNDSRKEQGSRVDRHAHIGQGCMGLAPFRHILRDNRSRKFR